MKKMIKKRVTIAIALAVILAGFYFDKKNCRGIFSNEQYNLESALIKKNVPLTIYNTTGSKVNAAFYNKRFKRSGAIICIKGDKLDVARRCHAPYLAVARNKSTLRDCIEKSGVPRTKIARARSVKISYKGHDLVVTPTGERSALR